MYWEAHKRAAERGSQLRARAESHKGSKNTAPSHQALPAQMLPATSL